MAASYNPLTDYEKKFQESVRACGEPCDEFRQFFADYPCARASVLDLGCGQGRDALMIARHGHKVHAVDISPTGVRQMMASAASDGLDVHGVVADMVDIIPPRHAYDIVVMDRVLHCLANDDDRLLVLTRAYESAASDGHLLIADTPMHMKMLREFFRSRSSACDVLLDRKGILVAKKTHTG